SGIGTEHVGHQFALLHERLGVCAQTIAIESRTAQGTRQMRTLVEAQPLGEQTLAERAFEEGGMTIEIAAGDCRQQVTEQTAGELGCEQDRHLAGWHRTRTKPADSALGSTPTDTGGIGQQFPLAIDVIPVVALHLPFAFGDHHAAQAVPGAGIAPYETMAVAIHAATLMGIEAGAVGVLDTGVSSERGRLAGQCPLDRLLRRDRPGVIEIQLRQIARHQRRVGQTGAIILARVFGDRQGGRHGLANGLDTGCRSTGRALALAHIQGDAEALVAIEFDGLHLTLAYGDGQSLTCRDGHFAGTGALAPGLGKDRLDLLLQCVQGLRPDAFYFTHNHSRFSWRSPANGVQGLLSTAGQGPAITVTAIMAAFPSGPHPMSDSYD